MYKSVYTISFFLLIFLLFSCSEKRKDTVSFDFYFHEKTMIINEEQDNQTEGHYLQVKSIHHNQIRFKLPDNFYIDSLNYGKWVIGWGTNKAYYDNGCENIREITAINHSTKSIRLGKILRGKGYPSKNQRIVFWNRESSGFTQYSNESLIQLSLWKEFAGTSNSFGGIEFDKKLNSWVMLFQECDTVKKQIYAAGSTDLKTWKPVNHGDPILSYTDFKHIPWAAGNYLKKQTPVISDVKFLKNQWIILLNGIDRDGQRTIGIGISNYSILGPYIISRQSIFKKEPLNAWNNNGSFSAKIAYNPKQHKYIIAFDGIHKNKEENVGLSFSQDLVKWQLFEKNPVIKDHLGWRSKNESSEVNYVEWRDNRILLLISGTKQLKHGLYSRYISNDMNRSLSGNVDDAQLGAYISTDNGRSFNPHRNNPLIVNDYTSFSENEHMGGNIKFIETDSLIYFFYQAKTNRNGLKYSIYLRTKKI